MSNLAQHIEADASYLQAVAVLEAAAGRCVVEVGGRRVEARRAAMCLIEPRAGDEVLVAGVDDRHFVLGVLTRPEAGATTRLSVDGDLEVAVPKGRLRFTSQKGVDITTAGEAVVLAMKLTLRAVEGEAAFERARVLAGDARAEFRKLGVVAETVETVCERLWQRMKRSYRIIDETDQVRAGNIDHRARQLLRIHADHTAITAKHLAKIDGEQIHVG
jgi:hypothetical protein